MKSIMRSYVFSIALISIGLGSVIAFQSVTAQIIDANFPGSSLVFLILTIMTCLFGLLERAIALQRIGMERWVHSCGHYCTSLVCICLLLLVVLGGGAFAVGYIFEWVSVEAGATLWRTSVIALFFAATLLPLIAPRLRDA